MGNQIVSEKGMAHPTFPRLPHPYIERNQFRHKRPNAREIIPFAEARAKIPAPVIPQRPNWEEMYWRAWEIAWSHLHKPKAGSGFVANYIDSAFNSNIFMWDSAFISQFGIYGRRAFDFLGTLDNFYACQHDDGLICREINMLEGYDFFHPFDPNGVGPNVLAWAEWRAFRHTNDEERVAQVFWPLLAFHDWFRDHRTWPSGLYWSTGLSSGMDNQPRIGDNQLHHGHHAWVDATMQAALNCWILAQMAQLLEEPAIAEALNEERLFLHREINARMWREDTNFYHDLNRAGEPTLVKSIGAYWGLLDKDLVPPNRLESFVRHLRDQNVFNRPHRVPSLSADSEFYDAQTGDYWRGGVWSPTNYMVLKGLNAVRQYRLAHQIAVNHLENVATVFAHTDTFWENYSPERASAGEPAKPDFVGWTGVSAVAVLLEDVIGIRVDWPLRRVTWERQLEGEGAYGVRNLPLGPEGTLDMVSDGETIQIVTNTPFNLKVRQGEAMVQTAVTAGVSSISL